MRERELQREQERVKRKREKEREEAAAAAEETYGSAADSPEARPPPLDGTPFERLGSPPLRQPASPPLPTTAVAARPSRSRENSTGNAAGAMANASSAMAAGPKQPAPAKARAAPKPKPAAVPGRSASPPLPAARAPSSPPLPARLPAARGGSPPVGGGMSELPPEAFADAGAAPPLNLAPCSVCGRNFAEERLPKHEQACSKAANSKRKKFDVKKHRVQAMGSEAASFARNATKTDKMYEKKAKKVGGPGQPGDVMLFFFFFHRKRVTISPSSIPPSGQLARQARELYCGHSGGQGWPGRATCPQL